MAKKFNFNIGDTLLSNVSKAGKKAEEFKVVPLSLSLIDPNKENEGISLDDIEELAQSILENGLDQNFVVVPKDDGRYKLLTGHRRRLACLLLVSQGHDEWQYVPCLIKDLSKIKLNLSQEKKELYALLTTNLQKRSETLADKLKMLQQANTIFDELQANGEDVGQRRKWLAEHLNVSDAQVKNLSYIQTHGEPELMQEIEDERVSSTVATEIAHLSPEDQKAIHKDKREDFPKMKAEDVGEWKRQQEIKKKQAAATAESQHVITSDFLEETKQQLDRQFPRLEHGLNVNDSEYQKLLKAKETLEKTIKKMEQLIIKAETRKPMS